MRGLGLFLAALALWLCAPLASAKWVEVESENFIFRGDVGSRDGETLVRELESFRANILGIYGLEGKPEIVKVPVYSVKNSKEMINAYGTDNVGGVYTTDFRGPIFLLSSRRGFGRGKEARYIAFHEYSHHLIAAYTNEQYPRWYNEGFANFLATYEFRKGTFMLGAPKQAYGPFLQGRKWMAMDTIIGSVRRYPFSFQDSSRGASYTATMYYAQSWLAVHYIQSTPGLPKKFNAYLKRLNGGEESLPAFEAAMGMSSAAFEKELRDYVRANRFGAIKFNAKADPAKFDVTVKEISKAEGLRHLADVTLAFSGSDKGFARTIAAYDKAEAALGQMPAILVGRADIASANGDYDQVEALIAQVFDLEPDNLEARRVGGSALVQAYEDGERDPEALITARGYLKEVLAAIPTDPSANYFYALSYRQDRNPPADAVSSARSALRYYRDGRYMNSNLALAQVLINGRDYKYAREIIEPVTVWGSNNSVRRAARSMLSALEQMGH